MTTQIDTPSAFEAKTIKSDSAGLEVEHIPVRKGRSVPVCYLTTTGDAGAIVRSLVVLNPTTGKHSIQNMDANDTVFEFDTKQGTQPAAVPQTEATPVQP